MSALDRLRVAFAIAVLIVWVVSVAESLIDRTFKVDATVHILMLAVATALFGPEITGQRHRNGAGPRNGGST